MLLDSYATKFSMLLITHVITPAVDNLSSISVFTRFTSTMSMTSQGLDQHGARSSTRTRPAKEYSFQYTVPMGNAK